MAGQLSGLEDGIGHVIEMSSSTLRQIESQLQQSRALRALIERGNAFLRFIPALADDVFWLFYQPDATLRPEGEGTADRLHRLIVDFLMESPGYARLRRRTALDRTQALLATEEFIRQLVECLAAGAHGPRSAAPSPADSLVAITGITFAQRVGRGGGVPADQALLVFAKEIERSLDGTAVLTDLSRNWRTGQGSLQALPYEAVAEFARRLKDTPALRRLAELAGRYRQIALAKQEAKRFDVPTEVVDVIRGGDLSRVLREEMASLCQPDLRDLFLARFAEASLHQYQLRDKEPPGRGSLVLCLDGSGSMAGEPEHVAKAIGLGLLEIACAQNRRFVAIVFGSRHEWLWFRFAGGTVEVRGPNQSTAHVSLPEGLVSMATGFFGGGTDFETPLQLATEAIADDAAGVTDGDIVFVTDDYCDVSDGFLEQYRVVKAARRFSTFSVLVGARGRDARTIQKFSDRVVSSFELTEDIAGAVFAAI